MEKVCKEDDLASKLKKLCDAKGREINPKQSAPILHKLGLIYKEKDSDKLSLIQSAALLVAAQIRDPERTQQLRQELEDLWCMVLSKATKKRHKTVELQNISCKVRKQVREMRSLVKNTLNEIPILHCSGLSFDELTQQEKHKIDCIENLQETISTEYKSLMNQIGSICVDVLGSAPLSCRFALVGMGSLARKDVTPYSDFECIIVLEEGIQLHPDYEEILEYFRWFAVIFQIIVITLGETLLPSVAIPCLNDFYVDGGDWFYDDFTPSGISFDGYMPHACKTPLGRQLPTENKPWKTELIKPVNEMLKYLSSEQDLKNGYHLADILTQTCYVFGDKDLYDEFASGVQVEMNEQRQNEDEFYAAINSQMINDAAKFDAIVDLLSFVFLPSEANVKRVFFRGITTYLSAMAKYHGLPPSSSFQFIDGLHDVGFLSKVDQHYFRYGLAIACELRLKVYARRQKQAEKLKLYPATDALSVMDIFEMIGKKCIVDFFAIANTVQNTKFEINRRNLSMKYESRLSLSCNFEILLGSNLYQIENQVLSTCQKYMHMFKLMGDTKLRASAWFFIGICLVHLKENESDAKESFAKCIRELLSEECSQGMKFYESCLTIYSTCIEYVTSLLTSVGDMMKDTNSEDSIKQAMAKYSTLSKLHKFFKSRSNTNCLINAKNLGSGVMKLLRRLRKFLSILKLLALETEEDMVGVSAAFQLD